MIDSKQAKTLRKMYEEGASYKTIADEIGAGVKEVDNFIFTRKISKESGRKVGHRGGKNCEGAVAPVHRLRKDQIIWLSRHYCKKHGKSFLVDYSCYLEENPDMNRVGILDLETSNLRASYGIILSYCILRGDSDEILYDCITKKDLNGKAKPDHRIVTNLVEDIKQFDILVTFYGTGFDIPFVRTRATILGIPFPVYGEIKHLDMYYVVRNKLKLHSNKLAIACECVLGHTEKTIIDPDRWIRALQGNKDALDYVLSHCMGDVRDLKRLYEALIDFRFPSLKSI